MVMLLDMHSKTDVANAAREFNNALDAATDTRLKETIRTIQFVFVSNKNFI